MSTEHESWLASLEVGDAAYDGTNIVTITGTTPTLLIVGPTRYRKSDGYRFPKDTGYTRPCLVPVERGHRIQRDLRRLRSTVRELPVDTNSGLVSTEEAERLLSLALTAVRHYRACNRRG